MAWREIIPSSVFHFPNFLLPGSAENPDQNTEDYLFQVILEKTIRIPRSLSVKAASILKGFLNKNPIERLGCDADRYEDC